MGKKKEFIIKSIRLDKLIYGGQAITEMTDGKKLLVWGGLPGELVSVRVLKKKKTYLEGIVLDVIEPSKDRVEPIEPDSFMSTSPWQIMSYSAENKAKQEILEETFSREGIGNVNFDDFVFDSNEYGYRNKMELGFWGNDDGLHLAHYVRGTHSKTIVEGSKLAVECINSAAIAIRDELRRLEVWGGKLKTIVFRASKDKKVVAALFIKEEIYLSDLKLPKELKGLDVYYSNPKSPASVATKKLYSFGDITLTDRVNGNNIMYDVMSFFQVNLPVFELALKQIQKHIKGSNIVDMYSGVGTIGVVVGASKLVESDENNVIMATENVKGRKIDIIHASSETAIEEITSETTIILDPPRAGLHKKVIERLAEVRPPQIIYLSCNPITQARDVKLLEEFYDISFAQGYNFFPRTPHIESLIVLELKK